MIDDIVRFAVGAVQKKAQEIFQPRNQVSNYLGQSRPNIPQQRPISINAAGQSRPNLPQNQPFNYQKPIAPQVKTQLVNPLTSKANWVKAGKGLQQVPSVSNLLPKSPYAGKPGYVNPQEEIGKFVIDTPTYMAQSAGRLIERGVQGQLGKGKLIGPKGQDILDIATVVPVGRLGNKGIAFSKEQIQYAKNFTPQIRSIIGKAGETLETGKRLKQSSKEADYLYSLGETVFGKEAAFLTPKQLKNAFDALQETAARSNIKKEFNIGLGINDVRKGTKLKVKDAKAGFYDTGKLKSDPSVLWHGSPTGQMRGGNQGLHIGTHQAAQDALEARIGIPANGKSWDGTQEYGKTLLAGRKTQAKLGRGGTGFNVSVPEEDFYPSQVKGWGEGTTKFSLTDKPTIQPVKIKGQMSNTVNNPMGDFQAGGRMAGLIKKGNAKSGYWYKNVSEDEGSLSAVVPSRDHLEILNPHVAEQPLSDVKSTTTGIGDEVITTKTGETWENLSLPEGFEVYRNKKTGEILNDVELEKRIGKLPKPSLQQPLSDAPLNMKGNVAKQIDEEINGIPHKVRLSSKATQEGVQRPRMGSDIAVRPRVKIKQDVRVSFQDNAKLAQQATKTPLSESIKPQTGLSANRLADSSFGDIINRSNLDVKKKIALWDFVRTPDRVFEKVGLGPEAKLLRQKQEDYIRELPKNIEVIDKWAKQVSGDANQRIFKYLDGQNVALDKNELKVANEIKTWLAGWADRLNLPKDKRITNYITHIFEKDFIQKEFDPDIAKIIRDRVAGSVYDPFVEQRLGKMGYIEDTWKSLDAYVKRATRKVHMDEALEVVSKKAQGLEDSQYRYIKGRIDKINMRPTDIDNWIDNSIKQVVGYRFGQRPTTALSRTGRQWVYRATLGLNPGTALKNLTQGANTYAKLGEKYTIVGYSKMVKELASGSDELQRVGVLQDQFIQDRTITATKKFWEKFDKTLFVFFETAEKINRGAAYYGAKSKALSQGASEAQAIEAGKKMVRDTQFVFGAVDTPAVLSSDIGKTLGQFQSFTLKQGEFLAEMIKNKEYAGLIRWSAASLGMVYTIGQLIGMKPKDLIPTVRIGVPPALQFPYEGAKAIIGTKDQYGNERDLRQRAEDVLKPALLFVPASTQAKKTIGGLIDANRGYSESRSGRVRFPVKQDAVTKIRAGVFGTNTLPEAQDYFDNKRTPLSDKQSQTLKSAPDKQATYNQVLKSRESNKNEQEIRDRVKETGKTEINNGAVYYRYEGKVYELHTQRPLVAPKLTGQTDLDKKLMSSFTSKISSRITEVSRLYEQGVITAEQAEKEIDRLNQMKASLKVKSSSGKGSSGRKPTLKKPKKVAIKKAKAGKGKEIKLKSGLKKVSSKKLAMIKMQKPPKIKKVTLKTKIKTA